MEHSKSFASHPKALYWSDKNTKQPNEIPLYYYQKYWFKCDKCPHEFKTNINSIARLNTWCPYCCVPGKKLCDDNECNICFEKSFASSDKVIYWSSKNLKQPRNVFKSCNEKFIFDCNKCGNEFSASLNNITGGKWCKTCGYASTKEIQLMKFDEFVEKAKQIHGDTYDYSKVIMNGVDRPVVIICNIHGEFNQTPYRHYAAGNGCESCGIIRRGLNSRYSFEKFLDLAIKIHGTKYDYSLAKDKYTGLEASPIPIICIIHGIFEQIPSVHLRPCGCMKCGKIVASNKQRMTNEEFIDRSIIIHGDKYDYSKTKYYKGHSLVIITCKIHGDFEQDPYNHLDGHGCHACLNKTEKKLYQWLKLLFPNIIKEFKPDWCINPSTGKQLRFDFMIPNIKIIVELDGLQHFIQVRNWICPEKQIKRDIWKMQRAHENGYKVIRISQDDVYRTGLKWLETNIEPEIKNKDRNHIFISSVDSMYDKHIALFESEEFISLLSDTEQVID